MKKLKLIYFDNIIFHMNPSIQKYLPESLWKLASEFSIPETFLATESGLIQLILESKSLAEHGEKQNRFNLLPIMSGEQIEKLRDILTREKQKLEEINQKYAQKQAEINQRYQQNYNPQAYYQAQAKIQAQENKTREQDLVEADNLLAQM